MEPRKIIKFGNSSYVITLPTQWMERHNLNKGDYLTICEKENSLFLQIPVEKEEKRGIINYNQQPLKLLNKELLSFYLKNYKYIEIRGKNIIEKLDDIRRFKEKISSIEITEVSQEKIVLTDLSSPKELNIHNLIKEIIDMEKLFFEELNNQQLKEKISFITQLDTNINKLSFLAHKAINHQLSTLENPQIVKDSISYWRIIGGLEAIGDIVKRIARYISNEENNKEQINHISEELKHYFNFITQLLEDTTNFNKNLEIYLDKKQGLLREIESTRENITDHLNVYLVVSQLFKDIIGKLDTIVISVIDLKLQ